MRSYKLIFLIVASISLIVGCSQEEKTVQSNAVVSETTQNNTPVEAVTKEDPKEEIKLSAEEQLSVDAITNFINEPDQEKQKSFVEANFHADVVPIFTMIYSLTDAVGELAEDTDLNASKEESESTFENARVVESKDYTKDGTEGVFVLISGVREGNSAETIVFIMDGKIGWIYGTENEEQTSAFNEVRKEFN